MRRFLPFLFVALAPLVLLAVLMGVDSVEGSPRPHREYVVRIELPPAGGTIGLPAVSGPLDASRPLVVIDAGHGGHDPGASNGHWREKDLTLALARALRDSLLAGGGIRVAMTREDDRYLMLEERASIARRLKADLFISIHADSAADPEAKGATVYTLSSRGSSEEAERMAARENSSDNINGVALGDTTSAVGAILVDLSLRRSSVLSDAFARLLLREGQGRFDFRDRPVQSAAFVVLKSPDVPSVLFEAGYISNAEDVARLSSGKGQEGFATAAAQAIRVFFARQSIQSAAG